MITWVRVIRVETRTVYRVTVEDAAELCAGVRRQLSLAGGGKDAGARTRIVRGVAGSTVAAENAALLTFASGL